MSLSRTKVQNITQEAKKRATKTVVLRLLTPEFKHSVVQQAAAAIQSVLSLICPMKSRWIKDAGCVVSVPPAFRGAHQRLFSLDVFSTGMHLESRSQLRS